MLLQQKKIFRPFRPDKRGKRRPFTRGAFCASVSENGYGSEAAGIKAAAALQSGEDFGSAKDTVRCIWRKIRHFSRHVRPRLPKRRALSKRQSDGRAACFAAKRLSAVLRDVCPPSCELADMRPPRGTGVYIGARENRQIRRFVCRWAAREAFRPPKKEVCKKPPMRSRPSGEGTAIRRGMPSDGECRPKTLFAGPTRQAAGEFCRNTQVKREVIHLSTRLSTMPAFYAVKKPQKRAGKERTGKEAFPRERALI